MLQSHQQGVLLHIRVQAGSRKQGVLGVHANRLKVAVHAAPEKGKANQVVIDILADFFDLKRGQLEIIAGMTNPLKTILIQDSHEKIAAKCAHLS